MRELRHQQSQARTRQEHQHKFADLEGKMCWQDVDGEQKKLGNFHSEIQDTTILFSAGNVELGRIHYYQSEKNEYDSDGCAWGNGEFYETSSMCLYLPYTKKDGSKVKQQAGSYGCPAFSYNGVGYDDDLGEYLLNFIKL